MSKANSKVSLDVVRSRFSYDAATGILRWKMHRRSTSIGSEVGCVSGGYLVVNFHGALRRVHRLIWLHVNGDLPESLQIDHIDGNPLNNRLANLRAVQPYVNRQNQRGPNSNNKSGLLGVTWSKRSGRWIASLRKPGTRRSTELGSFHTPEDAHAAYLSAKRAFHEGCTI